MRWRDIITNVLERVSRICTSYFVDLPCKLDKVNEPILEIAVIEPERSKKK